MRVIIIDDEAAVRRATRLAVEMSGHSAAEAAQFQSGLKAVAEEGPFEAVFLGLHPVNGEGLSALRKIQDAQPGVPVVLLSASADAGTVGDAMKHGAFDVVGKPFSADQIRAVLSRVSKSRALEQKVASLQTELAGAVPPLDFESRDPAMLRSLEVAFKAASSAATLLLLGPSGTGKSSLAREIHRRGANPDGPFVTVSCPSLSRELLESELFGHARGAFTGAIADVAGKVAAAEGGTLFLDEIGDLPLEIQPKLLRLLQEREYERVGENQARKANVRVIAATSRNLADEVRTGRFREDLFYRLNVIGVTLPGLKDRPGDLHRLVQHRLEFFARHLGKHVTAFSAAAEAAFTAYGWPGNLRELSNVVERAVILASGSVVDLSELPEEIRGGSRPNINVGARVSLEELEAEHIRRIIALARNLDEAARILVIDPATLYRKRQRMGLLRSQRQGQMAEAMGTL